ncbi:MAG: 3-hydroxybutyryl-CoA dehydrogenase [Planctomycetota bacterium]|nr:MAG: 3-hydroxybutyryl-CoA dehydrogenase [Planctomycetota bacterium]
MQVCAVLGAGTMGAGIAQVAAQSGLDVRLFDIDDAAVTQGLGRVRAMLDKGVSKGKLAAAEREACLARLSKSTQLEQAVQGCDVVIEAIPELLELKRSVFGRIASVVDEDCLLASNTSSLSIGKIAEGVAAPGRFVGMHFFNPVPLMKLIEVVVGPGSDEAAVDCARELGRRFGKDPITVKDAPGFASSRLGVALGLEAIRMLEEGVASAADIDKAMKLGYRHPMGPLELTDLVGIDVRMHIASYLSEMLDDKRFQVPALMRQMVEAGKLGKKSGSGFYEWGEGGPA